MIKYCKDKWSKNYNKLYEVLCKELKLSQLNDYEYKDLIKLSVTHVLNDNEDVEWDTENITEIDDGDYQGTLLYLIPKSTYQPDEQEYLMTYVGYGSCSGCDTLQSIQYGYFEDQTEIIKEYMMLCKDIICNMIKPYNNGWRSENVFDIVEDV